MKPARHQPGWLSQSKIDGPDSKIPDLADGQIRPLNGRANRRVKLSYWLCCRYGAGRTNKKIRKKRHRSPRITAPKRTTLIIKGSKCYLPPGSLVLLVLDFKRAFGDTLVLIQVVALQVTNFCELLFDVV